MVSQASRRSNENRSDRGKRTRQELARFLIVGFLTAAVYFGAFTVLVDILRLVIALAAAVAYVAAMLFNYTAHYHWTYRSTRRHGSSARRYLATNAVLLVINSALMALLVEVLQVNYLVSQVLVMGGIAGTTFLTHKMWVFDPPDSL